MWTSVGRCGARYIIANFEMIPGILFMEARLEFTVIQCSRMGQAVVLAQVLAMFSYPKRFLTLLKKVIEIVSCKISRAM